MKFVILIILVSFAFYNAQKKEIEIKEDFAAEVDYRLEKLSTAWKKRGVINFLQKNSNKNYKASVGIVNEQFTDEHIEEIKSECKNGNGLYYIRIKTASNLFFSSVKSCDLLRHKLHDKFTVNTIGQIKSDSILSVNYDVDNKYLLDTLSSAGKIAFRSSVEFVDNITSSGPAFPEEKEIPKNQPVENQSFLSKYWWMIMIVVVMMMVKGPNPDEGAASE